MIGKLTELKNNIVDSKYVEKERFETLVEEALREMYAVGCDVGWKSCGQKIIKMLKEQA